MQYHIQDKLYERGFLILSKEYSQHILSPADMEDTKSDWNQESALYNMIVMLYIYIYIYNIIFIYLLPWKFVRSLWFYEVFTSNNLFFLLSAWR